MRHGIKKVTELFTPAGELLMVHRRWDGVVTRHLAENSQQEAVRRWTPDDADRKFKDGFAANEWYFKNPERPVVYTLGLLAGAAWFTEQTHDLAPGAEHNFALRVYDGYCGQGLSRPFAEAAHDDLYENVGPVLTWLKVHVENEPALKTYDRLGYESQGIENDRHIMVRDPADLI